MYIEQKENIGVIRGQSIQRFIKRVIPLQVNFKTRVTVSTAIKFAPVTCSQQSQDKNTLKVLQKKGNLILFSLQYPFKIDNSNP
jgi:hypothetical protein